MLSEVAVNSLYVTWPDALSDEHCLCDGIAVSSIFGLLLILLLLALVLNVVARVLPIAVADESCRRRPWLPTHWREPIEEGEEIRFETGDGTGLVGTYLPRLAEEIAGIVVYSHELNGDRWNALSYVEHLRSVGFDVFTFNYRRHGRNEAPCRWDDAFEVTKADVADLRAAVRAAVSRSSSTKPRLGVFGVGKGAAIALCAAAEESAIHALVLDSIEPFPGASPSRRATGKIGWWRCLATRLIRRRPKPAFDLANIAPQVHVPVLMIHGRNDVHVGLDAVRTLASQIGGQCQLWIVPGARHAEAVHVDRNAYRQRSGKFLLHALQTRPAAVREAAPKPEAAVVERRHVSSSPAPTGVAAGNRE